MPPPVPPLYDERLTEEPPLTVPPTTPRPPKQVVPLLTPTPDRSVGCELPETTRPEPPPDGLWKAKVLPATVSAYQVLALHEEA